MQKFATDFNSLKELNQVEKVQAIKMIYPQRISEAEPYQRPLASR